MNVMLSKIATNLKVYGSSEDVVEATLALFQARLDCFFDCCSMYMSVNVVMQCTGSSGSGEGHLGALPETHFLHSWTIGEY